MDGWMDEWIDRFGKLFKTLDSTESNQIRLKPNVIFLHENWLAASKQHDYCKILEMPENCPQCVRNVSDKSAIY